MKLTQFNEYYSMLNGTGAELSGFLEYLVFLNIKHKYLFYIPTNNDELFYLWLNNNEAQAAKEYLLIISKE